MLKICTECEEEKEIEEFYGNKKLKDGHENVCKECRLRRSKEWYTENKDRKTITKKNWISNNRDKYRETSRKWREDNREQHLKNLKEWRKNNKERCLENNRNWKLNNKERNLELSRKDKAKRKRNFGYIPLNDKFPGSVGHHISKDCVVYIPEELHKSIPHKYNDPISMGEINILALEYL